jgi:HD domain
MRIGVIPYRVRQFWNALGAVPAQSDLELARKNLNSDQMALFRRMQPSEQAHSLAVMKRLLTETFQEDGSIKSQRQDLLVAALLHDVGKCLYPLSLWERVLVVLGEWSFPGRVNQWGAGSPYGWRRAFVIAKQHPEWGAKLAMQAGSSTLTLELIRRHQDSPNKTPEYLIDRLLRELQAADRNY